MSELKTCFKKVDYDLSGLLHYIQIGDIGLPHIQRPFVWWNAKVRDLFDSTYRGWDGMKDAECVTTKIGVCLHLLAALSKNTQRIE